MSRTKNVLLVNCYSSMKKQLRKIRMIFDIKNNDFESQILALFDSSPLILNSKFNNFLWVPMLILSQKSF